MICPKCGSEIKEGYLYCEKCGEEIRIVPDFDISLDEDIEANLASVVNEINNDNGSLAKTKELGITKELINKAITDTLNTFNIGGNKSEDNDSSAKKSSVKIIIGIALVAIIIILVAAGFISNSMSKKYSYDNQYEEAFEMYGKGDYEESIKLLKHVISMKPEEERPKLLLCDNYYELDKYDEALAVLEQLMMSYPNDMNIYERLVKNYEAKGDSAAISKLISETDDESVRYLYGDYLVPDIDCNPKEGTFEETQYIVLSTSTEGNIYYTLDGSEPDEKAIRYTEPIEILPGEATVKAICISGKGIKSNVIENHYIIDYEVPDAPILVTKSGQYTEPSVVEVKVPDGLKCYYTIDNSEPTVDSQEYVGPIPMYIGTHSFKFVCISDKNVSSDVVSVDYSLDIVNLVDMGTAVNNLKLLFTTGGIITDNYEYKCEQAAVIGGITYYIINEYVKQELDEDTLEEGEASTLDKKTGNIYAVDVFSGLTFKAVLNTENGTYTLSTF